MLFVTVAVVVISFLLLQVCMLGQRGRDVKFHTSNKHPRPTMGRCFGLRCINYDVVTMIAMRIGNAAKIFF